MTPKEAADVMLGKLQSEGCIYQDDVVDMLIYCGGLDLTRENADGNIVLGAALLAAFKTATETTVVWVRSDRYWRWRVAEDEPGRDARG